MDIKLPHSLLSQFLKTSASPEDIATNLSLCGPTVDALHKIKSDHVYDIEIITNRVDSASAFGIAREAAAILPTFNIKAELKNNPYQNKITDLGKLPSNPPVKVQILDGSLVPRFTCIALANIKVAPSPKETQSWLNSVDQRPIDNIVDISNELTLKYGQPVHIFDLDKIKGNKMVVRESKKGEKLTTLDDKTHTLEGGDIIIEDGEGRLIDLCGVMGGKLSEVDSNTKNILLFVQTYEPRRVRKTSLYTQTRNLAAQIFEKQSDPELVLPVLIEGIKLLKQRANATISSQILDIYPNPPTEKTLDLDLNWLHSVTGIKIPTPQITTILKNLGFSVKQKGNTLTCTVPTWRLHDINIKQDLAEEITRVYGYFRLPSSLPPTSAINTETDPLLEQELRSRQHLAALGFTEMYNYSLVSKEIFDHAGLNLSTAPKLKNPLSIDHEYMRPSLIPSLLLDLADNSGKSILPVRLFELANTYTYSNKNKELPNETPHLALITQGDDFLTHKGFLTALLNHLNLNPTFTSLTKSTPPFNPQQSATIKVNNQPIGTIGSVSAKVAKAFELQGPIILTNIDFTKLSSLINPLITFRPIPPFASVHESLTVTSTRPVGELLKKLKSSHPFVYKITYTTSHKSNHTFKLEFNNPKDNLTQEEVNQIKSQILKKLE